MSEGYLDTSLWRCTDGKGSSNFFVSVQPSQPYRRIDRQVDLNRLTLKFVGTDLDRHSLSSSQNVDHGSPRCRLSLSDEDIIEPR